MVAGAGFIKLNLIKLQMIIKTDFRNSIFFKKLHFLFILDTIWAHFYLVFANKKLVLSVMDFNLKRNYL